MEITSADDSALLDVRDAQAKSTLAKSELIFDNCGNRYFLAKLFDERDPRFSRAGARMFHACRLEARSKAPWIGVSNFNVQQLQRPGDCSSDFSAAAVFAGAARDRRRNPATA
jgi:hypothetical protein